MSPKPDNTLIEGHRNYIQTVVAAMRLNLLWFIPRCMLVVFYFVMPNAKSGYGNISRVLHWFTWGVFVSPSAYVFLTAVTASISFP